MSSSSVEIIRSFLDKPITLDQFECEKESGFTIRGQIEGYSILIENEDPSSWSVGIEMYSPTTIRKIQKWSSCSFSYLIRNDNHDIVHDGQFPRKICDELGLYDYEDEEDEEDEDVQNCEN